MKKTYRVMVYEVKKKYKEVFVELDETNSSPADAIQAALNKMNKKMTLTKEADTKYICMPVPLDREKDEIEELYDVMKRGV